MASHRRAPNQGVHSLSILGAVSSPTFQQAEAIANDIHATIGELALSAI